MLINHNGKENNVCVYIHITESLFCAAEISNIVNKLYLNKIKYTQQRSNIKCSITTVTTLCTTTPWTWTRLSCNWRFITFDHLHPFDHLLSLTSGNPCLFSVCVRCLFVILHKGKILQHFSSSELAQYPQDPSSLLQKQKTFLWLNNNLYIYATFSLSILPPVDTGLLPCLSYCK